MKARRRIRPRVYVRRRRPAQPVTNFRLQGVASALAAVSREQLQPGLAARVLDSLGLTVADLKAAGADAYDLAAFPQDTETAT